MTLLSDDEIRTIILRELAKQPHGKISAGSLLNLIINVAKEKCKFPKIVKGSVVSELSKKLNSIAIAPDDDFGLISGELAEYNNSEKSWMITERGRALVSDRILSEKLL